MEEDGLLLCSPLLSCNIPELKTLLGGALCYLRLSTMMPEDITASRRRVGPRRAS